MRVINVIEILNGIVDHVESFGVFEEQLSDEVAEKAEEHFEEKIKAKNPNIEDEELEEAKENGTWSTEFQEYYDICIVWSDI